jgi:two-component system sensor histidine kinase KdpD
MRVEVVKMQNSILNFLVILVLLTLLTLFNISVDSTLGITGVTLIYLLAVVIIAYVFDLKLAISAAVLAFLAINYFFTEPRYTFQVANIESLASLICFLIVSIVITSLVKQLKFQTLRSEIATKHAQFGRALAENLALATEPSHLLENTCQLLQNEFAKPFAILLAQSNGEYAIRNQADSISVPDKQLLEWVRTNGKPISPYTDYWSHSAYWLIPFSRLPNQDPTIEPILAVGNIDNEDSDESGVEKFTTIKSCVDQISQAYQRLVNVEKLKNAEFLAKTEAMQNALLASISHDMRTPLTTILGAATTLQQDYISHAERVELTALIASQAEYLANTTENILALIRLESTQLQPILMDWQSPEELIGVVAEQFKNRHDDTRLEVDIAEPELLFKANANLIIQALVNLIDNAKQAQRDSVRLNPETDCSHEPILIEVNKTGGKIQISVLDRGVGFNQGFQVSDIQKFSTTNPKGFGLGLSIVQAIAKAHNATFIIRNRAGGGVCATLSFNAENVGNVDA